VTLEEVAATTGGEYFHADDREDLERIYQTLDQLNPKQVESLSYRPEHELYFWPLGLAIILSLLFFGMVELGAFLQARRHQLRSDEAAV